MRHPCQQFTYIFLYYNLVYRLIFFKDTWYFTLGAIFGLVYKLYNNGVHLDYTQQQQVDSYALVD